MNLPDASHPLGLPFLPFWGLHLDPGNVLLTSCQAPSGRMVLLPQWYKQPGQKCVLSTSVSLFLEGESLVLSFCREENSPLGSTQLTRFSRTVKLKPQCFWCSSFLLGLMHGAILEFGTLRAPGPPTRDKHSDVCRFLGERDKSLSLTHFSLAVYFMVGQSSLSVRSCLDVRILNINTSDSLSLVFLCHTGSWNVQSILSPNPAAQGQEGYWVPRQLVESSKEADCPTPSPISPNTGA